MTLRWREVDSNPRSPVRGTTFFEPAPVRPRPPMLRGGPRVRILLPPAESQSLRRSRVRGARTPAFRAGVRGWFGDAVGRDAQGFPIRANLRQYLCQAIFQYRSAADVVGENPTPIPTKSGLPRFNVRQIFEFGSGSGKAEK